ncbi:uncharacterized protein LOC115885009 [Sitophilus oryzae]|uniref:Uncharacterized protein LOC115885009 n=1 Tax=Sitophilus oryzae TaxID=7048 RepID=A0A6J2Y8Q5_SITOR|nr:uncharacterized protein LOC115885009 [Sitophilus oryzae]
MDLFNGDRNSLKRRVLKKIDKSEDEVTYGVSSLIRYFQDSKILPEMPSRNMLEAFLIMNKFNIDKSKTKLEMYYKIRSEIPDFYVNKHPKLPHMKEIAETVYCFPLPRLTENLNRIVFVKLKDLDPNKFDAYNFFAHAYNVVEIRIREDVATSDILLYDMEGLTMAHFLKLTPDALKKSGMVLEKVYSNRVAGIHYLNLHSSVEMIINLIKKMLKEKLRNRIHIHKNTETLYEYLPRDVLPRDYDGSCPSLQELQDMWRKKMEESENIFDHLETFCGKQVDTIITPSFRYLCVKENVTIRTFYYIIVLSDLGCQYNIRYPYVKILKYICLIHTFKGMTMSNLSQLLQVTDSEKQAILKHYNLAEEEFEENVKYLKDWLAQSSHLPQVSDDNILRLCLLNSKMSLEKAKHSLEAYFRMRAVYSDEYFASMLPNTDRYREAKKLVTTVIMPKLTPDLCRITIFKFEDPNGEATDAYIYQMIALMMAEIRISHDYFLSNKFIFDYSNCGWKNIIKFTPAVNQKLIDILLSINLRIDSIHFVNITNLIEQIMKILKGLLPTKIYNKIHTHKTFESLHEQMPPEFLPSDYGGTQKSLKDLYDEWCKHLEESEDLFKKLLSVKSTQKYETEKDKVEMFGLGVDGSFKKLCID